MVRKKKHKAKEHKQITHKQVGARPTPLKNDGVKVSWDDDSSQYMEKLNSCSKPPTNLGNVMCIVLHS
jgi:hypothetical protein